MEDRRTNRLVESMNIFETIVNNKLFLNVSIILFLNKTDLLVEKIRTVDIRKNFPEFRGDPRLLDDVQVIDQKKAFVCYSLLMFMVMLCFKLCLCQYSFMICFDCKKGKENRRKGSKRRVEKRREEKPPKTNYDLVVLTASLRNVCSGCF